MSEPNDADRPVVVVLGAGMGGRGVARALTDTAHLVIVDRELEFAQAAADPVVAAGGSAEAVVVDLTDLAAVQAFRDDVLTRRGHIDAVVHLVGGWRGSRTVDADSIGQWRELMPGIVTTVQTTSVAFREPLAAATHGRYFMVTSTAVRNPKPGNAAYASLKSAAENWVRTLGAAFEGTSARAAILAVMALVDAAMREANPDRSYTGFTDTDALGATVKQLLTDDSLANGAYIDLSP
jgi:NAD(P)-dependent dehydrogenase (short-subunit alcohol dehydrogenase family)